MRPIGIGRRFTTNQDKLAKEGKCQLVRCDLLDLDAVAGLNMKQYVANGTGGLCLINNAGVLGPLGPVDSLDHKLLRASLAINVEAPAILAKHLLIEADSHGVPLEIVNVTSGAASKPLPGMSAYCAGKSAAMMILDCVAAERPDVKVTHIDPGTIDTAMQETLRNTDNAKLPIADYFKSRHEAQQLTSVAEAAANLLRAVRLL